MDGPQCSQLNGSIPCLSTCHVAVCSHAGAAERGGHDIRGLGAVLPRAALRRRISQVCQTKKEPKSQKQPTKAGESQKQIIEKGLEKMIDRRESTHHQPTCKIKQQSNKQSNNQIKRLSLLTSMVLVVAAIHTTGKYLYPQRR